MPITFLVKKIVPIPEFEEIWVQRFTGEEGFTCAVNCMFMNGVFNMAGPDLYVGPYNSGPNFGWHFGYRPEKIRIEYTSEVGPVYIRLEAKNAAPDIFDETSFPSGTNTVEIDLDWGTQDMHQMILGHGQAANASINNIEFLEKIPTGTLYYFDDSYWENYGEAWQTQFVNNEWVAGSASFNVELRPIGSWAVGFKPTNMRLYSNFDWSTKASGNIQLRTAQSGGQNLASVPLSSYTNGTNIPLLTNTNNIGNLFIPNLGGTDAITGIEFDFK
jgi:hypothetical protein